jgi:hypothetical protein
MRALFFAAVVLAAIVNVPAGLGAGLPPAKLALVPLPKAALGPSAASLGLAPDSGVVSNADAANQTNGPATPKTFAKLGRLRGYALDYGNGFVGGNGVRQVQSSVEVYRDADAARAGLAFWRKDETALASLRKLGLAVTVSSATVPSVGDEQFGYLGRISIPSTSAVYALDAFFRSGAFVVEVSVSAGSAAAAKAVAPGLARKVADRLSRVLAGKLTGPAVPVPAVKAGPPPQGPGLASLVLTPADLGQGTVTHQGYQVDKDLYPVSEFAVTMTPAGNFASLDEEVILMHSTLEAAYTISFMSMAFSQPATFTDPTVKSVAVHPVAVSAGDEAHGVIVTIVLKSGKTVDEALVLVRKGAIVTFTTVAAGGTILPSAVTELTMLAAKRLG